MKPDGRGQYEVQSYIAHSGATFEGVGSVQSFGVRELRNDTAGVLEAVERDGEALITKRGRVVAKLVLVDGPDGSPLDDFVAWANSLSGYDTGWVDEFLREKALDSEAAEPKPWE